jgi:hypothetical protein
MGGTEERLRPPSKGGLKPNHTVHSLQLLSVVWPCQGHNQPNPGLQATAASLCLCNEPLAISDVAIGEPQVGEVLVQIVASEVCYTDASVMHGILSPGRLGDVATCARGERRPASWGGAV